tara:strand:+ start:9598 stop:10833 length:1236 start_codon:yes stop_codon:yes gene_type:complete
MSVSILPAQRSISVNGIPFDGNVTTFSYYETLLSPFTTATFTYVDTGNSAKSSTDPQERVGTIRDSSKMRGNEEVRFQFENSLGILDFQSENYMKVDSSSLLSQSPTNEIGQVRLVSQTREKNFQNTVYEKFSGQVANSVKKILKEKLEYEPSRTDIENASIPYGFTGSNRTPYEVILHLASLSTPAGGDPGYFAYETKSGFYFKSIDFLMYDQQPINPKTPYFYNGVFQSDIEKDANAFKILTSPTYRDLNISKIFKSGFYAEVRFMYEDQQKTFVRYYTLTDDGKFENISNPPTKPTRRYTMVIPRGMTDVTITKRTNNDPADFLAKSVIRYNILMSQAINILIPCNPNLEAGNLILCKFEKVTQDSKELGGFNTGRYLILGLCHHFSATESYTSLTIVRDNYGNSSLI